MPPLALGAVLSSSAAYPLLPRSVTATVHSPEPWPPAYTVRVSARARRVRLTISPREGLVVVLPKGVPAARAAEAIEHHSEWVRRALERTAEHRAHVAAAADVPVPASVDLPGVGLKLRVEVRPASGTGVRGRLAGETIVLAGDVDDREAAFEALRRVVARIARDRLPLALGGIEAETGWSASKVAVRRQKTRWGSCSARRAISLNESLVYLPPRLVRYVLVHELAHTLRLDHSPAFWALVARHDADWQRSRRDLRGAWRHMPPWAALD